MFYCLSCNDENVFLFTYDILGENFTSKTVPQIDSVGSHGFLGQVLYVIGDDAEGNTVLFLYNFQSGKFTSRIIPDIECDEDDEANDKQFSSAVEYEIINNNFIFVYENKIDTIAFDVQGNQIDTPKNDQSAAIQSIVRKEELRNLERAASQYEYWSKRLLREKQEGNSVERIKRAEAEMEKYKARLPSDFCCSQDVELVPERETQESEKTQQVFYEHAPCEETHASPVRFKKKFPGEAYTMIQQILKLKRGKWAIVLSAIAVVAAIYSVADGTYDALPGAGILLVVAVVLIITGILTVKSDNSTQKKPTEIPQVPVYQPPVTQAAPVQEKKQVVVTSVPVTATNIENWRKWKSVHNTPDQERRVDRAYHADNAPLSISVEDGSGKFQGRSDRYETTLEHCTCMDFCRRNLPCKHMYRLAIELGCFGDKSKAKNDQYARKVPKGVWSDFIIHLIGTIENYHDKEQIAIKGVLLDVLYHQKKSVIFEDASVIKNAIDDGILTGRVCYSHFIRKMRKCDMLDAIETQGDILPEKCKLARDIAVWLIANQDKYGPLLFPNCMEVSLGPELDQCSLSVYKYLHRKYDETAYMETRYNLETGETHWVAKELPDDFETGLLNLFGTNPTSHN